VVRPRWQEHLSRRKGVVMARMLMRAGCRRVARAVLSLVVVALVALRAEAQSSSTLFSVPTFTVGGPPNCLAAGRFNGDGLRDLITAADNDNVRVLLGEGNGNFASGALMGAGNSPAAIAVGDFNGDGKLDAAVVNQGGNSVSILLGVGDGTFTPHGSSPVG